MEQPSNEITELEDRRAFGFELFRTSQHNNFRAEIFPQAPDLDIILVDRQKYGPPYPTAQEVYGKLATLPVCCLSEDSDFKPEWCDKFIISYSAIWQRKSDGVLGFMAFSSKGDGLFKSYFVPMGARLRSIHWALVMK
ncbi:MAG: hypothetical protein RLY43_1156 [Bacteroidota bacterium]|jgi:hypothetical protein